MHSMNFEEKRLKTFGNWPLTYISREELAKFGFYYTLVSDCVKCNFCCVEISAWEKDDCVYIEHKRFSPHCPLLMCRPTVNVAIDPILLHKLLIENNDKPLCKKCFLINNINRCRNG